MKLIAERNLKSSAKKFGYEGLNDHAQDVIETSLRNFVFANIEKAEQQARRDGKLVIEEKHVLKQRGGAETTLPLEYFGVNSKHYFDNIPDASDMLVSNSTIRPAMLINDPSMVFKGGAADNKFHVPFIAVKQLCQNQSLRVNQEAQKAIQQKFESLFGEVVSKTARKYNSNLLKGSDLTQVLQQRKYQKLFKQ